MLNICALLKKLLTQCLIIFKYARVNTNEQVVQANEKDIESNMNAELRAHEETFMNASDNKGDEFENKANFSDCEQIADEEIIRQFIEEIPTVNLNQTDLIIEIGQKSVGAFRQIIEKMDGFELLEEDQDFNYWIKYIETPEKFQIGITKYTFTLNTTVDSYLEFINDLNLQITLDNSIDAYERHFENQNQNEQVSINYLRYKKILFMDPRDFLYIKFTDRKGDDCIEISKSINIEKFQPKQQSTKQTTRAILLLSGTQIKQISDNQILITTYSECNMKIKLKPVMTKLPMKTQIKKMIKSYRDHFNK